MCTALFSTEGKYRAIVQEVLSKETDGYLYKVDKSDKIFDSQKKAIKYARSWLKRKRKKYYKKHPKRWTKRVRRNPIPGTFVPKPKILRTYHKIYVMKKKAATILLNYSDRKLKLHKGHTPKKYAKKTTGISGSTANFNNAICNVLTKGDKKERILVAKMLTKFSMNQYRKTNMFY